MSVIKFIRDKWAQLTAVKRYGNVSAREFLIFSFIIFIGGAIGGFIVKQLNLGQDVLSTLISFLIPSAAMYLLWKKVGERAA